MSHIYILYISIYFNTTLIFFKHSSIREEEESPSNRNSRKRPTHTPKEAGDPAERAKKVTAAKNAPAGSTIRVAQNHPHQISTFD